MSFKLVLGSLKVNLHLLNATTAKVEREEVIEGMTWKTDVILPSVDYKLVEQPATLLSSTSHLLRLR